VSNLLGILAAATDRKPDEVAGDYTQYGPLKADAADAVVELLRPVQARRAEVLADPGELHRLVGLGAEKAAAVAGPVYERAHAAVGFLG
jgi:tryptophanyl-tRNA synthetase